MSKFSLNSLAKVLSEKSGLSQMEAELFIRKMFDVCNQGLDQDKMVKIKWLGTFKVQAVKDRESIDVNTGERIVIEGRDKLSFTPDNILKEIVNKPFSQFETVVVNDGVDFEAIDKKFDEEETVDEPSTTDEDQAITSDEQTCEVIAFLDTESPSEPSSEVTVIGENLSETEIVETETEEPETEIEETEEEETEEKVETPEEETEKPKEEIEESEEELEESQEEPEESTTDSHHLLIPRYMVVAACTIVIALMGGLGWFAFNYGKMTAQRDHLAMQLNQYHQAAPKKSAPAKPSAPPQMTQEQILRKKAIEDSIRMAQASEAIKVAEQAEKRGKAEPTEQTTSKSAAETKAKPEVKKQAETEKQKPSASKYDDDARVRTGAYRITGVAEVVTVKAGQSIESISKHYLGPGMECYVEALNGTSTAKEGQKIKIPKLELKKKK